MHVFIMYMQLYYTVLTTGFVLLGPALLVDVPRDENITGKICIIRASRLFVSVLKRLVLFTWPNYLFAADYYVDCV